MFSGSLLHCSTAAQFRRDTMLFPISFLSVWFPPLSASMHARGRVSCAPSSLVAVLCSALLSPRRWRAAPTTCDGSASSSSRVGSNRQVKQSKGEWSCPMGHGRSASLKRPGRARASADSFGMPHVMDGVGSRPLARSAAGPGNRRVSSRAVVGLLLSPRPGPVGRRSGASIHTVGSWAAETNRRRRMRALYGSRLPLPGEACRTSARGRQRRWMKMKGNGGET